MRGSGEEKGPGGREDVLSIGERARKIRKRRGLSLEVAGGLAGITGPYLSMLDAIAVERGDGPGHAERLDADPVRPASAGRRSRLHLDLARGYAQAEGDRDGEAIRHLDTADRIAPTRIRNDPIARDLVLALDRRARRRVRELGNLRHRFGFGAPV